MEVFGSMKVYQLKAELKKRGAKSTGRKDELIERLICYDRNNNFREVDYISDDEELTSTFDSRWPPQQCFKSVTDNSLKNKLNSVQITDYFMKSSERDVSMFSLVLRKGYGMMEENFIVAIVEARQDSCCFYQSQVNSEFTKSLTYFLKVIIDDEGEVLKANCECVAGAGTLAGCKHVAATCFAILRYNERGLWPLRKTCTQMPQKWHMPKKQKINISPKKAQNLSFHVPVYDVVKKKSGNSVYDPRRKEHQNMPSFNDSVRNSVINYRNYEGNRTFGINGVYAAACVLSLVQDHDYLVQPLSHQWVYNQIQAFADDAAGIEKRTRSQSKSNEWHYVRSFIITASHVGEIVHMTDRRNKESFAAKLVCPTPLSTPAILWGRQHERTAKDQYEKDSYNKVIPCGLFISKDYPFIGASPDGLVCVVSLLEVKCPYSIRKEKISCEALQYLELKNGELSLKTTSNYYYQVQTQLFVTGRQYCDFVVWTTTDYKRIYVDRNEDVIKQEIIPKVSAFYKDYMVKAIAKHFYQI